MPQPLAGLLSPTSSVSERLYLSHTSASSISRISPEPVFTSEFVSTGLSGAHFFFQCLAHHNYRNLGQEAGPKVGGICSERTPWGEQMKPVLYVGWEGSRSPSIVKSRPLPMAYIYSHPPAPELILVHPHLVGQLGIHHVSYEASSPFRLACVRHSNRALIDLSPSIVAKGSSRSAIF